MKTWLVLLVPLMLSHAVEVPPPPVDKLNVETCEGLGFTQALACSTCKNIEDIVANEGTSTRLFETFEHILGVKRMSLSQYGESPHRPQIRMGGLSFATALLLSLLQYWNEHLPCLLHRF